MGGVGDLEADGDVIALAEVVVVGGTGVGDRHGHRHSVLRRLLSYRGRVLRRRDRRSTGQEQGKNHSFPPCPEDMSIDDMSIGGAGVCDGGCSGEGPGPDGGAFCNVVLSS